MKSYYTETVNLLVEKAGMKKVIFNSPEDVKILAEQNCMFCPLWCIRYYPILKDARGNYKYLIPHVCEKHAGKSIAFVLSKSAKRFLRWKRFLRSLGF